MKSRKWILKLMFVLAISVALLGCVGRQAEAAQGKAQKFTAKGLEAEVTYGLNGTVKNSRYMEVAVKIKNSGRDFHGKVRLLLPYNDTTTMYQKEASIAAGEEKTIKLEVPMLISKRYFTVYICNEREKSIGSGKIKVSGLQGNENRLIGILSEDENALGYFSNTEQKIVYLQKENISEDYKALDCLDVLVINNYTTGNLTEEQIKAICTWVEKGGTLLLGTGESAEKVLEGFSGELLQGSIGGKKVLKTRFGMSEEELESQKLGIVKNLEQKKLEEIKTFLEDNLSNDLLNMYSVEMTYIDEIANLVEREDIREELLKTYSEEELEEKLSYTLTEEERQEALKGVSNEAVEKEIVQLDLKNAMEIMSDGKEVLLQKINHGAGNVQVASFDLYLENSYWYTLGGSIVNVVIDNVPTQINGENMDYDYDYGIGSALRTYPYDSLPNVIIYVIILLIYIILVGPILYFILKRKDKRQLLWIVIPILSVTFSMFIYVTGTSTRIQKYFMTGVSILELDEEGELAQRESYYSIVPPSNRSFTVEVDGSREIVPYSSQNYYYNYNSDLSEDAGGFNYGVEYGIDQTSLVMAKHSAFEPAFFREVGTENMKGTVEIDFHFDAQQQTGTVSNTTEKNLENCCIWAEGNLYILGDISAGKSVDISQADKVTMDMYDLDYNVLSKITGYEYGVVTAKGINGQKAKKQHNILESVWNLKLVTNPYDSCFFGFYDDNSEEFDCEMYGMGLVTKYFDIQYSVEDGKRQMSLQRYGDAAADDLRYMGAEIGVNYRIPDDMKPKQLIYPTVDNTDYHAFQGEIYAKNIETNEMELIFNGSSSGETVELSKYMKNNSFYLEYKPDEKLIENYGSVNAPNIMIVVEDK